MKVVGRRERLELRLNDPGDSEINRGGPPVCLGAARPRYGAARAADQVALPRLDGTDSADGLADAEDDAIAKLAAAWSGTEAPSVRMLPERVTVAQLAAPQADTVPGVPVDLNESDLAPVHLEAPQPRRRQHPAERSATESQQGRKTGGAAPRGCVGYRHRSSSRCGATCRLRWWSGDGCRHA